MLGDHLELLVGLGLEERLVWEGMRSSAGLAAGWLCGLFVDHVLVIRLALANVVIAAAHPLNHLLLPLDLSRC